MLATQTTILLLLLALASGQALEPPPPSFEVYPSQIYLKAGVIHAPPFAMIKEETTTTTTTTNDQQQQQYSFRGYQIDLLERLKTFAAEDGVDLKVELTPSPSQQYADTFDLLARDCNTTKNPYALQDCQRFDMIVGDFYCNSERYMRADLSPSWLKTTMTTIKYIDKAEGSEDFTTLKEAEEARATVCVPGGTYLSKVVQDKFPQNNYIQCDPSGDECIRFLKTGNCVLFADDELLLHYRAIQDPSLEVTRESFNTQYLVWPFREDLPQPVSKLMKKWMYKAVETAALDDLYFQYFQREFCPHGTAGENCELPCDPDHGTADARGKCVCESTKWTGDDCSIEVMEELNLLPEVLVKLCYGMVGINFTLVAGCAWWLWSNRKRSQVIIAQPMFLTMILLGCVVSTSTIFALAHEDEGDGPVYACAALPWLYSVGFSLTFGALFARIRRIYIVLQSAVEMKKVTISAKETVLSVAAVLTIDVAILIVWSIVDPLQWTRKTTNTDLFGEPLESEGYCESDYWQVFAGIIASFHLFLMMIACYMCYLARAIPDRISHGKYVAIAMFSNLQIFAIAIPVLVIMGSDPQASFFVRSAAIWINDFVVVLLVFGSLMYKVYKIDWDRRLSKTSSQFRINEDIQAYAKKVRASNSLSEMDDQTAHTNMTRPRSEFLKSQRSSVSLREEEEVSRHAEREESCCSYDTAIEATNQTRSPVASAPTMLQAASEEIAVTAGDDSFGKSSRDTGSTTLPVELQEPCENADVTLTVSALAMDNPEQGQLSDDRKDQPMPPGEQQLRADTFAQSSNQAEGESKC